MSRDTQETTVYRTGRTLLFSVFVLAAVLVLVPVLPIGLVPLVVPAMIYGRVWLQTREDIRLLHREVAGYIQKR